MMWFFFISRRTSDGTLEKIDHKESRHGKSEGLFANENGDIDKILKAKRQEKNSDERRRGDSDRRGSSGSGIQARLGRSTRNRRSRSRSPVRKSDIRDRLGRKRD